MSAQTVHDLALEHHFADTWNARDLMAATFPEPRWAVPGLLTEGLNLLAGAPKVGKSWWALGVAAAVAAGGCALGSIKVEPGEVLYLALEDTPRRLQRRLALVLGDDEPSPLLEFRTAWPRLPEGGADRLADHLAARPDTQLVVGDVLAKMRGTPSRDSGSQYAADYEALGALKSVADEFGTPLLVLHHTRKQAADDWLDTLSGTNGIAGSADAILVMGRARNAADAVLNVSGRDVEEAQYAMRFDPTRGAWNLLDGPAANYSLSDERRRMLDLLGDGEARRPKQIAEALTIEHEAAKKLCQRMFADDQLDTDGSGFYFIPPNTLSPPSPWSPRDSGDAGDTLHRRTP